MCVYHGSPFYEWTMLIVFGKKQHYFIYSVKVKLYHWKNSTWLIPVYFNKQYSPSQDVQEGTKSDTMLAYTKCILCPVYLYVYQYHYVLHIAIVYHTDMTSWTSQIKLTFFRKKYYPWKHFYLVLPSSYCPWLIVQDQTEVNKRRQFGRLGLLFIESHIPLHGSLHTNELNINSSANVLRFNLCPSLVMI